MKKQDLFRYGFIALLLAAILVSFRSLSTATPAKDSCCRKSIEKCQEKTPEPGGMIWESISRQFFSSISPNY